MRFSSVIWAQKPASHKEIADICDLFFAISFFWVPGSISSCSQFQSGHSHRGGGHDRQAIPLMCIRGRVNLGVGEHGVGPPRVALRRPRLAAAQPLARPCGDMNATMGLATALCAHTLQPKVSVAETGPFGPPPNLNSAWIRCALPGWDPPGLPCLQWAHPFIFYPNPLLLLPGPPPPGRSGMDDPEETSFLDSLRRKAGFGEADAEPGEEVWALFAGRAAADTTPSPRRICTAFSLKFLPRLILVFPSCATPRLHYLHLHFRHSGGQKFIGVQADAKPHQKA